MACGFGAEGGGKKGNWGVFFPARTIPAASLFEDALIVCIISPNKKSSTYVCRFLLQSNSRKESFERKFDCLLDFKCFHNLSNYRTGVPSHIQILP
jgi:hypothetical protein